MKSDEILKKAGKLAAPFCITNGAKFRLKDFDPNGTLDFQSEDKPRAA